MRKLVKPKKNTLGLPNGLARPMGLIEGIIAFIGISCKATEKERAGNCQPAFLASFRLLLWN